MMGWPSMASRATQHGIPLASYPSLPPWPEGVPLEHDNFSLMDRMVHGPEAAADIVGVAKDFRPDVIVVDCMMGAGFRAAASVGVATCVLCHVLYNPFLDLWGDRALEGNAESLFSSVDLVLVLVPPGLEDPRELPATTLCVGPICHPDSPAVEFLSTCDLTDLVEDGPPWVLVSLSTNMLRQEGALQAILDAIGSLPVRGLLTLGDILKIQSISIPENVVVRSYIPHDFVLPYVDAVVSHGGLSTISASLATGKPLVCIPQGRDQALNAAQVEARGAGRMLAKDASPTEIAGAIDEVAHQASFHVAAEELAAKCSSFGRGGAAVEYIEQLVAQ